MVAYQLYMGTRILNLDLNFIKEKYEEGLSFVSISKLTGVSQQTINRRLNDMGVKIRIGDFQKGHKILSGVEKGWFKSLNSVKKVYKNKRINGKKQHSHRIIMEEHLGRKLTSKEVVHHIDGDPKNNNIENLKLFSSQSEHMKYHIALK